MYTCIYIRYELMTKLLEILANVFRCDTEIVRLSNNIEFLNYAVLRET